MGGKRLSEDEVRERITCSKELFYKGVSKKKIAAKLKIPPYMVNIYSQGFSSQKEYDEKLKRLKKKYRASILRGINKIPYLGYDFERITRFTKGINIDLTLDCDLEEMHVDFQEFLEIILEKSNLSLRNSFSFGVSYNRVSLCHQDIYGRAFLEVCLEDVLEERMVEKFD